MIDRFDFEAFRPTEHMLLWLASDPIATLRKQFVEILTQQVPGSGLLGLRVLGTPEWITGALPTEEDPNKAILVRTGVAFQFELSVETPDGDVHDLAGVFTWVGVNLDEPAKVKQRTWFDLNGDIAALGSNGELKNRMHFSQSHE